MHGLVGLGRLGLRVSTAMFLIFLFLTFPFHVEIFREPHVLICSSRGWEEAIVLNHMTQSSLGTIRSQRTGIPANRAATVCKLNRARKEARHEMELRERSEQKAGTDFYIQLIHPGTLAMTCIWQCKAGH